MLKLSREIKRLKDYPQNYGWADYQRPIYGLKESEVWEQIQSLINSNTNKSLRYLKHFIDTEWIPTPNRPKYYPKSPNLLDSSINFTGIPVGELVVTLTVFVE